MTPLLHWAQNNSAVFIILSLAAVFILKTVLVSALSTRQTVYYVVVFPGVILHEITHLIACLITFAKIRDFKLFSKTGGYVRHEKSPIPLIGSLLISLAPLLGGLATLMLVYKYAVGIDHNMEIQNLLSPKNFFYLYLSVAIILSMLPSFEDLKNSYWQLGIFVIAIIIISQKTRFIAQSSNYLFFSLIISVILLVAVNIVFSLLFTNKK